MSTPHKFMVDWKAQLERAEQLKGGDRPKNEDILIFSSIEKIEEKIDIFDNDDGTKKKVTRFYYYFKDRTLIVPVTLHRKIARLKVEYGDRLDRVKFLVEGTGIKTRYDALPLL